jgi:DNA (cytosine-5)-methyltransferase 1
MGDDRLSCVETCAGGGGQALGLEQAGFDHRILVDNERWACETLRANRPHWNVMETDIRSFSAQSWREVDLLAGGLPCPPFTIAGKQLGEDDDRNLFPEMLRLTSECEPRAVFVENVPGLLSSKFDRYRDWITAEFERLGYVIRWGKLNASDFGVPQLRPRSAMVGFRDGLADRFRWPSSSGTPAPTVGEALYEEISAGGWRNAAKWRARASAIAPTLVGGSKKHGGPDLGPTRAKRQWRTLGVDGLGLVDKPPTPGFRGRPRLTVRMCAILQGFPADWKFAGTKTQAYRQVGNAFPPPVAKAMGRAIRAALLGERAEEAA